MLKSCYKVDSIEVGIDESGYGSGIGDLYVAGVIFPKDYTNPDINDSKKTSAQKREELVKTITTDAIEYHIVTISRDKIDKLNVYQARLVLFHQCIDMFSTKINHILVDGNSFLSYNGIKHTCIPKADAQYVSVAAASILAKTYRDEYVSQLHEKYPDYNWASNKGYLTKDHIKVIQEKGITEYHRKSFLKKILNKGTKPLF